VLIRFSFFSSGLAGGPSSSLLRPSSSWLPMLTSIESNEEFSSSLIWTLRCGLFGNPYYEGPRPSSTSLFFSESALLCFLLLLQFDFRLLLEPELRRFKVSGVAVPAGLSARLWGLFDLLLLTGWVLALSLMSRGLPLLILDCFAFFLLTSLLRKSKS